MKTQKWETEEDTRRWKGISCSWIGRINIIKMVLYQNKFCKFRQTEKDTRETFDSHCHKKKETKPLG